MKKYEEELKVIIKRLVAEHGLDKTLDYISGIVEDIDFENYRKILWQEELEEKTEKNIKQSRWWRWLLLLDNTHYIGYLILANSLECMKYEGGLGC